MSKRTVVVLAVIIALLLVAGTAVAQETDRPSDRAGRDFGRLWAVGEGSVDLDADRGVVRMFVIGDVAIMGPSDLRVRIEPWVGDDEVPTPGDGGTSIELDDFAGVVVVRGHEFTLTADGLVALQAAGEGEAMLAGTGGWHTRSDKGLWPATIPLGAGDAA